MNRRGIVALGSAAWLAGAWAQPDGRVYRVGVLRPGVRPVAPDEPQLTIVRQALRELGYEEGRNLRTARAIGLAIPPAVRLRADEVIE